ncbi:MAG: PilZ domain-containing protein [Pyrinomonadaceae bacterium]
MACPRCGSLRVQRGYKDASIILRAAGLHELLCNNCGLEFRGFDPLRKPARAPVKGEEKAAERRRFPRYQAHLPVTISLVERNRGNVAHAERSRGHCETISQVGMALSFAGTRFSEGELRPGRLLLVTVALPDGDISAVVTIITSDRLSTKSRAKWLMGTAISQISESDAARLKAYIAKRAEAQPFIALE